jgi:hypothetical protein
MPDGLVSSQSIPIGCEKRRLESFIARADYPGMDGAGLDDSFGLCVDWFPQFCGNSCGEKGTIHLQASLNQQFSSDCTPWCARRIFLAMHKSWALTITVL